MNILVFNDLHSGSDFALVPKRLIKTPAQAWMWDRYQEIVNHFKNISVDYLFAIGDMVDGYGKHNSIYNWTTDVQIQADTAIELLRPFVKGNTKVFGVSGSGYHTGKGTGFDGDELVVEGLGGKFHKNTYYLSTPYGYIQFIHVAKNIKGEVNTIRINNGESDGEKVKLLVAAHLHRVQEYREGSVKAIHCPCWQYNSDFMQGFGVSTPVDIGYTLIRIDEFGMQAIPITFPVPMAVKIAMAGWTEITEKEIKERNEEELKKLSDLTGVSANVITVIKNNERKPLILPKLPPSSSEIKI